MPKPRPRSIEVEIYDQKYSIVLRSDMSEAEVRSLAEDVDERMREISAAARTPDSLKIAILTALHLAQELREQRKSSTSETMIEKKCDELSNVLEEILRR